MERVVEVKQSRAGKVQSFSLNKNAKVKVKGAEWIKIVVDRSEVQSMEQNGDDLVVRFSDGTTATLQDYFLCAADQQPRLAISDPVAGQTLAVSFENGSCDAAGGFSQKLAYSLEPAGDGYLSGFVPVASGIGLAPLLGLGALGAGGAAAAGGGGGGGNGGGGGGNNPPPDTTAPAAPTIAPTNGTRVTGTAEAGSSLGLDLDGNGTTDATVPVDGQGNWTYTPATPIPNGTTIIVKATDPAGNVSPPASTVVDAATPTPTITTVTDDVGAVTGDVANGGTTDDDRPTIVGTGAEANATVAVFDGATQIGTATANASGAWSFTPAAALGEGAHSFTARATDALGNVSGNSAAYVVTIDSDGSGPGPDPDPVPTAPVITGVADDVGSIQGGVANGGVTDDARPAISGNGAPANGIVTVFDGTTQLGTTTANGSGNWSFTPPAALGNGAHSFTATATSGSQTGPASNAYAITVDTVAPAAPQINPTDGTAVSGMAEPNTTISLDLDGDGDTDVTTPTNGSGNWGYTPVTPIPDGTTVIARATDAAGNTSPPASAVVDVDAPPAAPVITVVVDDIGVITGTVAKGGVTDDTRPAISGSGGPSGATVSVFDGGNLLGTATANASGNWSFTPPAALGQGGHSFTASVTAGGQTGPASSAYAITVDTTPPAPPTIAPTDGSQIVGTAEPGASVLLDIDGNGTVDVTVPANGSGNWSYTPPTPIPDGTTVTARARDAAGNTSGPATAVVDDGEAPPLPAAPTISTVTDDVGPVTGTVGNGGVTDDTRPAIAGAGAPAGATVSVYDGANLLGTTTASGSGSWTFTPANPLAQGAHNFTATVSTAQGTSPASSVYGVTIDTTPPAPPVISPTDGGTVTGTAEPGSTVRLDLDNNGTVDVSVPANGSGTWSYTPPTPIPDGTTIAARAVDAAGNVSGPGSTVVDADSPPPAPVIGTVTDDVGAETGPVANGGSTDDTRPAISGGGAEAGATVMVFDGTTQLGTTTADAQGNWSFTPTNPLNLGQHVFSARVTDGDGDMSAPSAAYAISIVTDTTPPAAPVIGSVNDDVGAETGPVPNGGNTDDTRPTVTGSGAEANATVTVFDGATQLGTTTANGSGDWSFTPVSPLSLGSHSFTARVTDAAGNVGPASNARSVVIVTDTTPPGAPVITSVADDIGISIGNIINGAITDDTRPTINGTAEANATLTVFDGTTELGTTTANGSGAWSFTPATPLGAGSHSFTAAATDAAGNTGGASNAWVAVIVITDIIPPAAPTITGVTDDVAPQTGNVANNGTTDDVRPTIVGNGAEANSTVTVFDGATELGTTTADGSGNWSFTPAGALGNGSHSFTARVTDDGGNVGPASGAYTVTVSAPDTTAPTAPVIGSVNDDVGAETGPIANGGNTDDTRPTVTGSGAEANATVTVFDGTTQLGTTTANGSGNWSFTPANPLSLGSHSFTATVTDTAGNTGPASNAHVVVIVADTTPPGAPVIDSVSDDIGIEIGTILNGAVTDDSRPTIIGSNAEANATVTVYDGGNALGTTTANGAGVWSFTPATPLGIGLHSFTARVTDAAGNIGPTSNTYAAVIISLDIIPPAAPTITGVTDDVAPTTGNVTNGGTTNDTRPTVTGTGAEANATVTVFDGADQLGTTTADGSGNWSFTPAAPIGAGGHSFTARVTDAAGNVGPASGSYAITVIVADTTPPVAPVITSITDNVGAEVGSVASGDTTDDTLPRINGTAEANATVTVYDGATLLGTATANGSGNWNYTPSTALPEGPHSFTATATDAAGNTGPASNVFGITIAVPDTTPPPAPVITSVADDIGVSVGNIINGAVTDDTRPTINGTAEANATIAVFDGADQIGTTTANGSGAWSFTPSLPLGAGLHTFTATATDAAGNTGNASNAWAAVIVVLDITPPAAPTITGVTDDVAPTTGNVANNGTTDDPRPTIVGTGAEPNSIVTVFDGANQLGFTTANGSGGWSFTPSGDLSNGSHAFTARVTDDAGNVGPASGIYTVNLSVPDTTAPTQIIEVTAITDNTPPTNDWITSDHSPTFSGTLSAALAADERVEFRLDNTGAWQTAFSSGTSWAFAVDSIGNGAHTANVRVIDAAGNLGDIDNQAFTILGNSAPVAMAASGDLLGLVGAEALDLIQIGGQAFNAFDRDNNLQSVSVKFQSLLGLGQHTLTAFQSVADELGISFNVVDDPGSLIPLQFFSSTLTITGALTNQNVNELLATVHFTDNISLLGGGLAAQLLSQMTVTASDGSLSDVSSVGSLLDLTLLDSAGPSNVKVGTGSGETISGGAGSQRLYGLGGDDTLNGDGGNDLLRGGSGADTLHGGDGNDVLVWDAADLVVDGGTGSNDILLIDAGSGLTLDGSVTKITNIEHIHLGLNDGARSLSLTAAGIANASPTDHLLVTGGDEDTVTLTGATFTGYTLANGHLFAEYNLGTSSVSIESAMTIIA